MKHKSLLSISNDFNAMSEDVKKQVNEQMIKGLESDIRTLSQKYYEDGTSPVSDEEFDRLLLDLKVVDPKNPLLTVVGHGYDVNEDSTYGVKVDHMYGVVGSLNKVHNWSELDDGLKNRLVVCLLKLDGISCVLYYKNSKLVRALTRGDGVVGIDITSKLKVIAPDLVNLSLDGFTGAIRGELVMKFNDFDKFKIRNPEAKNPRNSTAGLINKKQIDEEDLKCISFILYSIMASGNIGYVIDYGGVLYLLSQLHETVPYKLVNSLEEDSFDFQMSYIHSEFQRSGIPDDGLVLADNTLVKERDEYHSEFMVSWNSQAYKFPSDVKETSVKNVEWNLSKTGYLIPKVNFDDIQLAGTSVSYATAFNAKYVKDMNLHTGSVVKITKSGEIIPYILEVRNEDDKVYGLPEVCPECGERLSWNGVHLQCTNDDCTGKLIWDVIWWIKSIAPADGLSDTLIQKFATKYNIHKIKDIYDLPHMEASEGTGKQEALFIQSIEGCKNNKIDMATAIRACNVPRFGQKTCKLCNEFYDVIVDCLKDGFVSSQNKMKLKIGNANLDAFTSNFNKILNVNYILQNVVKVEEAEVEYQGDVCITGKLSVKRKDFENELKSFGWNPVSSVKKSTKFLITDNPSSGSSKNKSADKYGVPKISEGEFRGEYLK